jgi:hypothetical protein
MGEWRAVEHKPAPCAFQTPLPRDLPGDVGRDMVT